MAVHGPVVEFVEYWYDTVSAEPVHVHVGVVLFVGDVGPVTVGADGGEVSIVTSALPDPDQLPAASRPCTHRVYDPVGERR